MKKYKEYYYPTKKSWDGYVWVIRNKERKPLELADIKTTKTL